MSTQQVDGLLIIKVVQPAPSDEGDLLIRGTIQSRVDGLPDKDVGTEIPSLGGKVNK